MCGIVGVIGNSQAAPLLYEALKRLEYRGYDSAGIATLTDVGIDRRRAEGKLDNLKNTLDGAPLEGKIGIGHTRWATHGAPTEGNAHPHVSQGVAVVHNGIIENFQSLREELKAQGHSFTTETDTEASAHLVAQYMKEGLSPKDAAMKAISRFEGAFGLVFLFEGNDNLLIVARKGSPLAIGHGDGEMFIGSDALALAPMTDRIQYLDEGDVAVITRDGSDVFDMQGRAVTRPVILTAVSGAMIGKGNHRHFMEKEIHEQPAVLGDTLRSFADPADHSINLPDLPFNFNDVSRLAVVACGTASLAGMVSKYWFEQIARLPVDLDIASEFRYREPPMVEGQAGIVISQSGETMDTLFALRQMKEDGCKTLSIVNVPESTIARESDAVLRTLAGPEIGVASTKAFTTQLATLACLVIGAARERGTITAERQRELTQALDEIPARTLQVLEHADQYETIAHDLAEARDILYIGRGTSYAIAMEGALKLKEISYIHAEGYAAGELKHGPIALIDDAVPIIVVAPRDGLFDKTASAVQEVKARGGKVVLLSDQAGVDELKPWCWHTIAMPSVDPFVSPILYSLPIQLLAYYTAVAKGTDVDQPRNLAKSVTVE